MPKCPARLQPWQVFHAAIKTLSAGVLASIFGKANIRTVYLYGADPDFTEQRCKNPLEALHLMFRKMDEVGRGDVARCAIDYLSTAIDDLGQLEPVGELKKTIDAEVLQDYAAVANLRKLIDEQADPAAVKLALHEAMEELQRTYAKYLQELGR